MTEEHAVHWSVQDGIATVTLHRPQVRNALDDASWAALRTALTEFGEQRIRALVLTGGDRFFSAGGDVSSMADPGDRLTGAAERLQRAHGVFSLLSTAEFPVIAAVERYAIGVAWGLVLACDLVVAAEDAFFQAPFALRGLVADGATAWALPRAAGRHRAMRYLLLGERMPAREAFEFGLVTELAEPGTATTVANGFATRLAEGPRESNALTKSLVRQGGSVPPEAFLEAERLAVALAGHGRDSAEGRAAFLDKREPDFT
ncbi:enoyl-CoA hydratase/isomerase family protein [Prauserella cavernicola]|uniref:Enoyl-CoA hydratase/isomerase family protein n=1 Tax=Prauserella cavernicola TaxID=2800127 RepID=A0A934V421_9PSEU|nr:enoyl-CoA hydratase/isomerase family protein [Prauserella cavernicola]MBK1783118.1 enoyl-CoA hydratase/isomerase family protein [Prauserella cavernicola]